MEQILQRKFKVSNAKVMIKQKELFRLARVRCRSRWAAGNECLIVGCLELACKLFSHPFDREIAYQVCGQKLVYNNSLNSLRNLLGITDSLSIKELCVKFGCTMLGTLVRSNFEAFKEKFLQGLPQEKRHQTTFSKSVYLAVAFFLTAKSKKCKVDRGKLRQLAHNCSESEFSIIQAQFEKLLPHLNIPEVGKKREKVKAVVERDDISSSTEGERSHTELTTYNRERKILAKKEGRKRKTMGCGEKENKKNAKRSKLKISDSAPGKILKRSLRSSPGLKGLRESPA